MGTYILRRLIQTIAVIVILSYVVFSLMALMPGDPVELMISSNPRITPEDVARLREFYGLDQPGWKRYLNWVSTIAQGDLGYSRTYRVPVADLMGPRLLNTFILSVSVLLISLMVAIPLGVITALKPGGRLDSFLNLFSFAGISVPSFWLGLMLIIIFAVQLGFFPAGGTETVGVSHDSWWSFAGDRAYFLFLPVLSLTLQQIGRYVRFARSAMLEALRNDYIRTAKAKGLPWRVILWKHAFRNALIPLITVVALSISGLFSGAILTENVFAYQGMGRLLFESIVANDFNVAMIAVIISITMVLFMNLVADILYGYADPRISYH